MISLAAATAEDQSPSGEHVRSTDAERAKLGWGEVVYLACRTDGIAGSGTQADPYDASTAEKFDHLMADFYTVYAGRALTLRLAPGIFQTASRDSYGPNRGSNFGAQHWLHKNWVLQGSGMYLTEIRNVNPDGNGVTMFNSAGGTWGGPGDDGGITISDVTLNPQMSVFMSRTMDTTTITADGSSASGTKRDREWNAGTQIRITNATNPALNGAHKISAITPDTFSFESRETTEAASATVQQTGQWTGTRLNGGDLRLFRVRAIDCGSSAPEVECWPLWLGSGDGNMIDECVVENCSGTMSAIAIFPGTHPIVRNSRVDATGCPGTLAISGAAGLIVNNYIKNAAYGIYADTFSNEEGTVISGNIIDQPANAGVYLRPINHHRTIIIANNVIKGGSAQIGIAVNPLTNNSSAQPKTWLNGRGEKIWIDDVTVSDNSVGDKLLLFGQIRGLKIIGNTAGGGRFFSMTEQQPVCYGNRTMLGGVPSGLRDQGLTRRSK